MGECTLSVSFDRSLFFRKSFGDRLLRSLEYVGFKARSHNAVNACELVNRVLSEQKKYALFRELFPNEWKRSKASLYRAGRYTHYSERACELFELVHEHCFPLLDYWNDDPEAEFERFAIMPLNFDLCCEEIDLESMRVSYAAGLIFYLQEADIWDFLFQKYGLSPDEFAPVANRAHPDVWKARQSRRTKPLSMLFRLIDHSTGNPWLDLTYCEYADMFEWDKKTIEELTRDHYDAGNYFKNLEQLDECMEADPTRFVSELISFWNNGRISRLHEAQN
jgi:hypothetical protein